MTIKERKIAKAFEELEEFTMKHGSGATYEDRVYAMLKRDGWAE